MASEELHVQRMARTSEAAHASSTARSNNSSCLSSLAYPPLAEDEGIDNARARPLRSAGGPGVRHSPRTSATPSEVVASPAA
jgi:hypothetical protein